MFGQIVLTVSCMTCGVIMTEQSNYFGHAYGGCTGPTINHSETFAIISVYMMPIKKLDYVICLLRLCVHASTYLKVQGCHLAQNVGRLLSK